MQAIDTNLTEWVSMNFPENSESPTSEDRTFSPGGMHRFKVKVTSEQNTTHFSQDGFKW